MTATSRRSRWRISGLIGVNTSKPASVSSCQARVLAFERLRSRSTNHSSEEFDVILLFGNALSPAVFSK